MTERPRSILVAVDFGEASGRAVSIGGALAARCGASLRDHVWSVDEMIGLLN